MTDQLFGGEAHSGRPTRDLVQAMRRGALGRCPRCGEGRLFRAFSKTVDTCQHCGEEISHHRADDLPAYLVIFIVGHITVGGFMGLQAMMTLPTWLHLAIWAPLTVHSGAGAAAAGEGRRGRPSVGALHARVRRGG